MTKDLNTLLAEAREIERMISEKIESKEAEFLYQVKDGLVVFENGVAEKHRKLRTHILRFLSESSFLTVLTAPFIYSLIIPALFMDLFVWTYQFFCFPVYQITKVNRGDYFAYDRKRLMYLNSVERFNCVYCSYFNGLISYVREVASRTEQYWCPIRHALRVKGQHPRVRKFIPFGDAADYHRKLEVLRKELARA